MHSYKRVKGENPHCGETNQHALTQTEMAGWLRGVFVGDWLFVFHCVAPPFHSFVTTHTDPMQPASQPSLFSIASTHP